MICVYWTLLTCAFYISFCRNSLLLLSLRSTLRHYFSSVIGKRSLKYRFICRKTPNFSRPRQSLFVYYNIPFLHFLVTSSPKLVKSSLYLFQYRLPSPYNNNLNRPTNEIDRAEQKTRSLCVIACSPCPSCCHLRYTIAVFRSWWFLFRMIIIPRISKEI